MSKTYKVAFNGCYGGFSLSNKAIERLNELGILFEHESRWNYNDMPRHHPLLIQVIEELGTEASDQYSNICISEIDCPRYKIEEYDGSESVITPNDIRWIEIEK